jgi:flagellar operon protein
MADITSIPGAAASITEAGRTQGAASISPRPAGAAQGATPFAEVLRARQGVASGSALPPSAAPVVRFSAHAQTRLQSRKIALDSGHIDRLQGAVQKAASKGSRDALVLMDDLAMVVSVTNRTVVTVVDKENLKQNVFTNIDSAVIA